MRVRVSGAWKEVPAARVRVGSAWKQIVRARAYISGAWKDMATFVPPLSLVISPATASAIRSGPGTATTNTVTVTPTGGQAPYTYAWVRTSGLGSATVPNGATTAFSQTLGLGDDVSGTFQCTVTDSLGTTATVSVTANFTSVDGGGF